MRSLPPPAREREQLREFPVATAEALPPVFCMLCSANFVCVEDLHVHVDQTHGGLQRYRHAVLHLLSLRPFVLTPVWSRAIVSNFSEFYCRGSLDWTRFSDDMRAALGRCTGLPSASRWAPRRMLACVCCESHDVFVRAHGVVWRLAVAKRMHPPGVYTGGVLGFGFFNECCALHRIAKHCLFAGKIELQIRPHQIGQLRGLFHVGNERLQLIR